MWVNRSNVQGDMLLHITSTAWHKAFVDAREVVYFGAKNAQLRHLT
jgi:hypothetical protein